MTAVATPPSVSAPQLSGKRPAGDRIFAVIALAAGLSVLVRPRAHRVVDHAKRRGRSSATTPRASSSRRRWAPNEGKFGSLAFVFGTFVTSIIALVLRRAAAASASRCS